MKQIFLLTIISFSIIAYGQQDKFEIGVEGGPNVISLRGNEIIKTFHKPTTSYLGSVFFQYNFPKTFAIRTNVSWERKGSVMTIKTYDVNGNSNGEIVTKSNFNYITAPILFRANFGTRFKFFLNGGPFIGYLLKQTFTYESKGSAPTFPTQDNTGKDKRFDLGASLGLGAFLPIKNNFGVSLEIRDNLGLLNVSGVKVIDNGSIKTNSINLLLGLTYRFGKRDVDKK